MTTATATVTPKNKLKRRCLYVCACAMPSARISSISSTKEKKHFSSILNGGYTGISCVFVCCNMYTESNCHINVYNLLAIYVTVCLLMFRETNL